MGIVITKYENNNDVKFDVSKFDNYYDDDSFPTDAETDVRNILLQHGDFYNISREEATVDGMGHSIAQPATAYAIYGKFQDITIKDRQIHEMGLAVPGNRKFYVPPDFKLTSAGVSTTWDLREGDIITDNKLYTGAGSTGQFRVVKILNQYWQPGNEVFRTAIVQSINLDGS